MTIMRVDDTAQPLHKNACVISKLSDSAATLGSSLLLPHLDAQAAVGAPVLTALPAWRHGTSPSMYPWQHE
jgi:hypothetical protein